MDNYYETLEEFVGETLQPASKPYGITNAKAKEDRGGALSVSLKAQISAYKRAAKPVEVWTEEQKEMLKRIDEILARPIPE